MMGRPPKTPGSAGLVKGRPLTSSYPRDPDRHGLPRASPHLGERCVSPTSATDLHHEHPVRCPIPDLPRPSPTRPPTPFDASCRLDIRTSKPGGASLDGEPPTSTSLEPPRDHGPRPEMSRAEHRAPWRASIEGPFAPCLPAHDLVSHAPSVRASLLAPSPRHPRSMREPETSPRIRAEHRSARAHRRLVKDGRFAWTKVPSIGVTADFCNRNNLRAPPRIARISAWAADMASPARAGLGGSPDGVGAPSASSAAVPSGVVFLSQTVCVAAPRPETINRHPPRSHELQTEGSEEPQRASVTPFLLGEGVVRCAGLRTSEGASPRSIRSSTPCHGAARTGLSAGGRLGWRPSRRSGRAPKRKGSIRRTPPRERGWAHAHATSARRQPALFTGPRTTRSRAPLAALTRYSRVGTSRTDRPRQFAWANGSKRSARWGRRSAHAHRRPEGLGSASSPAPRRVGGFCDTRGAFRRLAT